MCMHGNKMSWGEVRREVRAGLVCSCSEMESEDGGEFSMNVRGGSNV